MNLFVSFATFASVAAAAAHATHLRPASRALQAPYFTTTRLGSPDPDVAAGNPMKGLMTNPNWQGLPYNDDIPSSLEFYYIKVNEVMLADPNEVGVEAAFDWSALETDLDGSASRMKHGIPRFYLHYPESETGVPQYLIDNGVEIQSSGGPDYSDPQLLEAMEIFIEQFGARYDGDQRIGFIQMGILGKWGEWNGPYMTDAVKESVASWFLDAFTDTKLQVRYAENSLVQGVGYHDDSFGYSTLDGEPNGGVTTSWFFWPKVVEVGRADFWKTGVMGGETRPELQDEIFSPDYDVGTENKQDFDLCVETTHATYMLNSRAFKENGDEYTGQTLQNARRSSARMGYNYHVSRIDAIDAGGSTVDIHVEVTQVGVAPFYYPLSLELSCVGASQSVPGVNNLVENGESGVFVFSGVPATTQCLEQVEFSLTSTKLYPGQVMKFAQSNGMLTVDIPLPEDAPPTTAAPTVAPVSTPTTNSPTTSPTTSPVTPPAENAITGFTLIDADGANNVPIAEIFDGSTFDLNSVGTLLSVRADATTAVDGVTFTWESESHTEGAAAWAMDGNSGSNYNPVAYLSTAGLKTVSAAAVDSSGESIGSRTVSFALVDDNVVTGAPTKPPSKAPTKSPTKSPTDPPVPPPTTSPVAPSGIITQFVLIDASSDQPIGPIADGDIISLAAVGSSLNIDAETDGTSLSKVTFYFDGSKARDESYAAYALGGNSGSNFYNYGPLSQIGSHTVTADGIKDGEVIGTKSVTFDVVA